MQGFRGALDLEANELWVETSYRMGCVVFLHVLSALTWAQERETGPEQRQVIMFEHSMTWNFCLHSSLFSQAAWASHNHLLQLP